MANIVQVIRETRRALGLERRRARVGDGTGRIYVPGRPGYIYVRFSASDNNSNSLTPPTAVRLRANLNVSNDLAVIVAHDRDGVLAIVETDFQALEQSNSNPLIGLQTNHVVNGAVDLNQSPLLRSQPVGGSEPLSVSVLPLIYVSGITVHWFAGEKIDLTASRPGAAGEWCLAGLFLKTDDTIEIALSTAQPVSEPFTIVDIQECVTAATADSLPSAFWQLTNGQTIIVDSDKHIDLRQWLNIGSASGAADDSGLYIAMGN